MDDTVKLISTFVDAVALIMALVLMVSILHRLDTRRIANSVLIGVMFSLVLVFSMSDPIQLGDAGIFDMRGLLIGAGAALFGPVVGTMTLVTGFAVRWGIGGNGMIAGFVGMACAYGGGLAWLFFVKPHTFATWKKSVLLGVMISTQMTAILFTPKELWGILLTTLVPYIYVSNVLGALLINHLISGELSFLSESENSKAQAGTDPLTGLLNRRGLKLIFPTLKPQETVKKGRAILCFDLDHFKSANDAFGHAIGDEVLKRVVNRISQNLRQNDLFARLGGDEFVVVLPQVDVMQAQDIANRCRSVVADEPFLVGETQLPVTISLGAVWLRNATELDDMLETADQAMYQAKLTGRNAVVFMSKLQPKRPTLAEIAPAQAG